MKRISIITMVICAALAMAACSGVAASPTASATSTAVSEALDSGYQDALSVELQLALGTLRLAEDGDTLDSATAGELLPLWKAVRSLNGSDTTSELEMQALYRQIEESLSAEQVAAIAAMQLTSSDLAQTVAGFEVKSDSSTGAASTLDVEAAPAGPGDGQATVDALSGGMGEGTGIASPRAGAQDGAVAVSGAADTAFTAVLNAVITQLEEKSQA